MAGPAPEADGCGRACSGEGVDESALLQAQIIRWLADQDAEAYLVGGCVRDALLGRPVYDLDVATPGSGLDAARRLANEFGGAYYALDASRQTGRAILGLPGGRKLVVDVARMRDAGLPGDLAERDFTVNALAASVTSPGEPIDLHGGRRDLELRTLRVVSEASIRNDPVRALRAARLASELGLSLAEETVEAIHRDGSGLADVAAERVRDEIGKALAGQGAAVFFALMDELALLTLVFPELEPLRRLAQPIPHRLDALSHSLETVRCLDRLLDGLGRSLSTGAPGQAGEPATTALLPLAERVLPHVVRPAAPDRPRLVTTRLAALLHDVGKATAARDDDGPVRFHGHDALGAEMVAGALRRLRFSTAEVKLGESISRHHMRPLGLARQAAVSARAVVRFFRDTGEAGVETLLVAVADCMATYAEAPENGACRPVADLAARMLANYWERLSPQVAPSSLVTGAELMELLALPAGPLVGELLAALREAQLSGELATRQEALDLAHAIAGRSRPGVAGPAPGPEATSPATPGRR